MTKAQLEETRAGLQAVLDNYLDGFRDFEEGPLGQLEQDATEVRMASLKSRIAYIDEKIARLSDA